MSSSSSSSHKQKSVYIQALNLVGDFVTITNSGNEPVDASGWVLESKVGGQTFSFPNGTVLLPGTSVSVFSGKDSNVFDNPPASLFWTKRYVWNDNGDAAVIKNAKGEVVDEKEVVLPKDFLVEIQQLDLRREAVTVINKSHADVDLSNWLLVSLTGAQSFTYPADTVLKPGATVTVWSGKDAESKNHPPRSLFWTKKYIWNDKGDVAAIYNANGMLVHSSVVHPVNIPPSVPKGGIQAEKDKKRKLSH